MSQHKDITIPLSLVFVGLVLPNLLPGWEILGRVLPYGQEYKWQIPVIKASLGVIALLFPYFLYQKLIYKNIQKQIRVQPEPSPPDQRLEESRESVLKFVSENSGLETDQITSSFLGSEQRALFNLQELEKSKFIIRTYVSGSDMMGTEPRVYTWSTTNLGLAYLNKHGFLK